MCALQVLIDPTTGRLRISSVGLVDALAGDPALSAEHAEDGAHQAHRADLTVRGLRGVWGAEGILLWRNLGEGREVEGGGRAGGAGQGRTEKGGKGEVPSLPALWCARRAHPCVHGSLSREHACKPARARAAAQAVGLTLCTAPPHAFPFPLLHALAKQE